MKHDYNIFLNSLLDRAPTKLVVADIDGTLIDENSDNIGLPELRGAFSDLDETTLFAYATGRNLNSIEKVVKEFDLPEADFMIASVGSAIYYDFNEASIDCCWDDHIRKGWNKSNLKRSLATFPGLTLQGEEDQSKTKLSYFTDANDFNFDALQEKLKRQINKITLTYSHNAFLDILPIKASKAKAISFISEKLHISDDNIIVCGDSGNDLDMLDAEFRSIIVANHSEECSYLREKDNCFFTSKNTAEGVVEGLKHWGIV